MIQTKQSKARECRRQLTLRSKRYVDGLSKATFAVDWIVQDVLGEMKICDATTADIDCSCTAKGIIIFVSDNRIPLFDVEHREIVQFNRQRGHRRVLAPLKPHCVKWINRRLLIFARCLNLVNAKRRRKTEKPTRGPNTCTA